MRKFRVGQVYGLELTVEPQFVWACLGLAVLAALIGGWLLRLSVINAIAFGVLLALLHALSVFLHDLGHGIAARRTGYPMTGIVFGRYGALATTVYPPDEPELPGKTHIQRALGGPLTSFGVAVLLGALTFALSRHSVIWWVALIGSWHNLITFTLQIFVPVPWADGGTLAKWRN